VRFCIGGLFATHLPRAEGGPVAPSETEKPTARIARRGLPLLVVS